MIYVYKMYVFICRKMVCIMTKLPVIQMVLGHSSGVLVLLHSELNVNCYFDS